MEAGDPETMQVFYNTPGLVWGKPHCRHKADWRAHGRARELCEVGGWHL